MPASSLTDLLNGTAYLLAYAVPLLLVSLAITFAGTFLTLDRTRSFKPHYDALPSTGKRTWKWRLQGGLGGLCIGWAFGLHLATLLSTLIPSTTSSNPLNSSSFLAVWLLSAISTTLVASRWQFVAISFATLSGSGSFVLMLSLIIHPSLLTRKVLLGVFVVLVCGTVLACRLLRPQLLRVAMRFCTGSLGAYGIVQSAAALAHIPEVANASERWWVDDAEEWGSSKEKGLCAGFCLFLIAGMACDWILSRFIGECPDEQWDAYLSDFARNMPNQQGRAGLFRPFKRTGPFGFLFPAEKDTMIFPPSNSKDLEALENNESRVWSPPPPAYNRKLSASPKSPRKREKVKFTPHTLPDYSSDEEEPAIRPSFGQRSSTATLVNSQSSRGFGVLTSEPGKLRKPWVASQQPEYSDYEEELNPKVAGDAEEKWEPGFIRKASLTSSSGAAPSSTSTSTKVAPAAAPMPVPATPSLIKAIERVREAQYVAVTGAPGVVHAPKPSMGDEGRWTQFWEDVKKKSNESS